MIMIKNKVDGSGIKIYSDTFENFDLLELASSDGLFGEKEDVYLYDSISKVDIWTEVKKILEELHNSTRNFIFIEQKIPAEAKKTLQKWTLVPEEEFAEKRSTGVFDLANKIARRDKKGAWLTYRREIENGNNIELIHGTILWQIKVLLMIKLVDSKCGINPHVFKKNKSLAQNTDERILWDEYRQLLCMRHERKRHFTLQDAVEKFILGR